LNLPILSKMMKLFIAVALCLGLAFAAAPPKENSYKWADDWSAYATNQMIEAQGASTNTETEVCCLVTSPQCKIEVQDQQGDIYVSVKHQATRQNVQGGRIYQFFNENPQMQYGVAQAANGSWVCQDACPIRPPFPPLSPGFLPYNATYMGKKTPEDIKGCPTEGCDLWQVKQVILGIIVMETDDFYVYESASQGVPVAAISHLTPFGEPLGSQTQTWAQYQGYPEGLPASTFEFLNKKNCPPPKQGCQQQQQDKTSMYYAGLQTAAQLTNFRPMKKYVTDEIRAKYNIDFEALDQF